MVSKRNVRDHERNLKCQPSYHHCLHPRLPLFRNARGEHTASWLQLLTLMDETMCHSRLVRSQAGTADTLMVFPAVPCPIAPAFR